MRKYIVRIQDWVDDNLRRLCGRITPEKRLAVLLTMFLFFGITSIYIFVSAIYNIGKNEGQQIEIEHIQMLELQKKDSINQLKFYNDGREQN
ncbi:TraL conjugative transposon family protein [Bacteroides neonati]|uniref:TraL conjugative transposon family protein n=1 Tax=Bacteroides neonati TaxID=1347393 RepID=UPI0004B9DB95|nr:TraL conjugative transposon family protein [Bacteroides neonati]